MYSMHMYIHVCTVMVTIDLYSVGHGHGLDMGTKVCPDACCMMVARLNLLIVTA